MCLQSSWWHEVVWNGYVAITVAIFCLRIKNTDISSHLKLPPVKIHCSVLAEEAIQAMKP